MRVIREIDEIRAYLKAQKEAGKSTGLVPTMGALHDGHLSLIEYSLKDNDITIVTIFVNPAQFNNPEDLIKYPRDEDADLKKLEGSGCTVAFLPTADTMYSPNESIEMQFSPLSDLMEGAFRPGHFSGVALVLSKFFNIIKPDNAYFGQKDLQQFRIIEQLNNALKFDVQLHLIPIVREKNGLALSSRNMRLSVEDREKAGAIRKNLLLAKDLLGRGKSIKEVKELVETAFSVDDGMKLEYFEIVSAASLQVPDRDETDIALCIAVYINGIRLIDNTLLTLPRI